MTKKKGKLKRYTFLITFGAVIVSLFTALCVGLVCESVLYVAFKLTGYEMPTIYRLLIDFGAGAVVFAAMFLILRKGKKGQAKIIDRQLDLKEKVATMYALEEDTTEIAKLQREDAMKSVEGEHKKHFYVRINALPIILSFVFAFACFITHVIRYPVIEQVKDLETEIEEELPETPIEEEEEPVKDNNIQDMIDSIERNDNISDNIQDFIKNELEELDKELQKDETNEERDEDIKDTIDNLEEEMNNLISYGKIGEALQAYDSTKELGEAISSAAIEQIKIALDNLIASINYESQKNPRSEMGRESDTSNQIDSEAAQQIGQDILSALEDSQVDSSDALYKALQSLANSFLKTGEVSGQPENGEQPGQSGQPENGEQPGSPEQDEKSDEEQGSDAGDLPGGDGQQNQPTKPDKENQDGDDKPFGPGGVPDGSGTGATDSEQDKISEAIDQAKQEIEDALKDQMDIQDAFEKVMEGLQNMMTGERDENQRDENDRENQTGAGVGSGETIYGADEILYDPEMNTHVTYGELLNYYYGLINATITEDEVPAHLERMIYTYFGYLFYSDNATEGEN